MAEPDVIQMPERARPLPEMVDMVVGEGPPPHSPRESALLREFTGKELSELVQSHADMERMLIWLKLRRLGYDPTWEQTLDVLINTREADPLDAASSTPSPGSATSGG